MQCIQEKLVKSITDIYLSTNLIEDILIPFSSDIMDRSVTGSVVDMVLPERYREESLVFATVEPYRSRRYL